MAVSYRKLWKLLIDKNMKKKDLAQNCDAGDIMEIVDNNELDNDNFQGGYTNEH